MFGGVPGTYKNLSAARAASRAYEIEDKAQWVTVSYQNSDIPDAPLLYQPCERRYLQQAKKEGWILI